MVGCVGVVGVLEFRFSTCLSTYSLAGWGVGLSGCSGDGGVCFGFGNELFGAAYHLRDECHIFNIFGVTVRSE